MTEPDKQSPAMALENAQLTLEACRHWHHGDKWRNLPGSEKVCWEEHLARIKRAIDALTTLRAQPQPQPTEKQNARWAIDGAIAFGMQGIKEPPEGHWLTEYWDIGRKLAAQPVAQEPAALLRNAETMARTGASAMHIVELIRAHVAPTDAAAGNEPAGRFSRNEAREEGYREGWIAGREAARKEVPTNWIDPLLSGPKAVSKGDWNGSHIEALLRGIQDRIEVLQPPSAPPSKETK